MVCFMFGFVSWIWLSGFRFGGLCNTASVAFDLVVWWVYLVLLGLIVVGYCGLGVHLLVVDFEFPGFCSGWFCALVW